MTTSTYKNHEFTKTSTTTYTANGIRNVYEISGEFGKGACVRPFLTSVSACRDYVNRCAEDKAERQARAA